MALRKWSVAIEADDDLDQLAIECAVGALPGITVVNVEEIEKSFTEEEDEGDPE